MALPEPIQISRKILSTFFGSEIHNTLTDEKNGSFTLSKVFSPFDTSDQKGTYTLWKFPVKEELFETWNKYPLYFSFRISLRPDDEIAELNIKLFKEDNKRATISSIRPTELLLRVEWSNEYQTDATGRKHAQPHWHIHSYTIVDKLEGKNAEDKQTILEFLEEENEPNQGLILEDMEEEVLDHPIETTVTAPAKEIPSFKFHLAMLAEWEKPAISRHDKILTNESLKQWLPKCLKYLKEQVEYILEKM